MSLEIKQKVMAAIRARSDLLFDWKVGLLSYGKVANLLATEIAEILELPDSFWKGEDK